MRNRSGSKDKKKQAQYASVSISRSSRKNMDSTLNSSQGRVLEVAPQYDEQKYQLNHKLQNESLAEDLRLLRKAQSIEAIKR